jgi:hypothetical protein
MISPVIAVVNVGLVVAVLSRTAERAGDGIIPNFR